MTDTKPLDQMSVNTQVITMRRWAEIIAEVVDDDGGELDTEEAKERASERLGMPLSQINSLWAFAKAEQTIDTDPDRLTTFTPGNRGKLINLRTNAEVATMKNKLKQAIKDRRTQRVVAAEYKQSTLLSQAEFAITSLESQLSLIDWLQGQDDKASEYYRKPIPSYAAIPYVDIDSSKLSWEEFQAKYLS